MAKPIGAGGMTATFALRPGVVMDVGRPRTSSVFVEGLRERLRALDPGRRRGLDEALVLRAAVLIALEYTGPEIAAALGVDDRRVYRARRLIRSLTAEEGEQRLVALSSRP